MYIHIKKICICILKMYIKKWAAVNKKLKVFENKKTKQILF